MNSISQIHDKAMQEAARAELAKLIGDEESVRHFLRTAYELEVAAAEKTIKRLALEPTRSVLFKSAAWLAFECGELREAERLACIGLSGNPPDEIADELREVIERVNFRRHLDLRGYILGDEELQVTLAGEDVMSGAASFQAVTERATNTIKLLYRTAQRKTGQPYKDEIPPQLKKQITPYMTTPRAASFAFSIRFAEVGDQGILPGLQRGVAVIDEFLTCTEFFIQNKIDLLKTRINSEAYFRNFLKLTEKIAPDGHDIKMVGFTAIQRGKTREVNLTIPQESIKATIQQDKAPITPKSEPIVLKGKLLFADAIGAQNTIKVLDPNGKKQKVTVPEGLMDDIVGPLWNRQVVVDGLRVNKVITLSDIRADDE
jgi:hypothetical protein